MFFTISLYASLIIFGIGTLYKIASWFRRSIGIHDGNTAVSTRLAAATRGIVSALFSKDLFLIIKVFILDVILQRRVLNENFLRWLMHILIYVGFMLLLFWHAMDVLITEKLFPDYFSTLNPFMFLRDFFGFLVVIGIVIAVYRRITMKVPRLKTNPMDRYAVGILVLIIFSGIFLEGLKITSFSRYQEMIEEYSDTDDEEDLKALESLWVKEFGVISPNVKGPFSQETLELGREFHELSCEACHSRPAYAFTGYVVAKAVKPVALSLDRAKLPSILWYIHFLACFVGLAYLPFSKMFHILASPVSLLANAVMDKESHPANIATRQIMELDACTHCGTCSRRCSVAVAFHKLGNLTILPSEKMVFLKKYVAKKELGEEALRTIQEGAYLCTNCDRCTVVCPVGINLRELWVNVKEEMIQRDLPAALVLSQFSFYRGIDRQDRDIEGYGKPLDRAREAIRSQCELMEKPEKVIPLVSMDKGFQGDLKLSSQAGTYDYCYSCENCTTVCPVVENYENPQETLGLLPHQIMRSLGLGLKDLAIGSNMLWDCVTCYQCQEHCPQGVKVTDVLYELKNRALKDSFFAKGA